MNIIWDYNSKINIYFNHLDWTNFKIDICPNEKEYHNKKLCFFYHQYYDKRRDLKEIKYETNLCNGSKINCHNGNNCKNSHNKIELFYHPKNYKTKYCIEYLMSGGNCEFKNYCSFAHSKEELKINILENFKFNYNFFIFKYKTEYCPLLNFDHDKNSCVYAHSIQDFRRKNMMQIVPKSCKYWKMNKSDNYESNCPKGYNCKYCHGFKEYDYHPFIFKTKPCYSGKQKCKFGAICHFYHKEEEKRELKDITTNMIYSCKNLIMKESRPEKKKLNPKTNEFIAKADDDIKPKNIKNLLKEKLKNKNLFKQMSTVDNLVDKTPLVN